jgi:hypothetical protein
VVQLARKGLRSSAKTFDRTNENALKLSFAGADLKKRLQADSIKAVTAAAAIKERQFVGAPEPAY